MKLSTIIKGSVCVLGLVGVGNFFAAPANADQAAARGAVTIVRPSGSSISVSGELVLDHQVLLSALVVSWLHPLVYNSAVHWQLIL